ncbi:hypothetical protein HDF19_10760 [Mucilaginibacter sp. E4BP6]|uniref:hypothetical protein n=1 Tax=Mucilaginibacter sp. E4BP6 TaxID=2723089 RepID=UPI0015CD0810|nr:hypothetical protein [Mucilaginibacter sp. E4BP6]NYE65364.1 hypothetical protein [Mucilaginibacter sp. E4BP6]
MKKQPVYIRLLIAGGLLMVTMPFLLKEYICIPDFFRGFLGGAGLVFEIAGIVLMKRKQKEGVTSCQ